MVDKHCGYHLTHHDEQDVVRSAKLRGQEGGHCDVKGPAESAYPEPPRPLQRSRNVWLRYAKSHDGGDQNS
ncbi:hypothetical protein D3C85_1445470 [compost metagenome]